MYDKGTLVEATDEAVFVQKVIPPVFNRTYEHFLFSFTLTVREEKKLIRELLKQKIQLIFIHPIFTTYQNWAPAWFKNS